MAARKPRKLGRTKSQREALLRELATQILKHGRIETTLPKAKEVKPFVDRIISIAKKNDLAARRRVYAMLNDKKVAAKVFSEIVPRFEDRNSGFVRVLKTGNRPGDKAPMALIELV